LRCPRARTDTSIPAACSFVAQIDPFTPAPITSISCGIFDHFDLLSSKMEEAAATSKPMTIPHTQVGPNILSVFYIPGVARKAHTRYRTLLDESLYHVQ